MMCTESIYFHHIEMSVDFIKAEVGGKARMANDAELDFLLMVTPSMGSNRVRHWSDVTSEKDVGNYVDITGNNVSPTEHDVDENFTMHVARIPLHHFTMRTRERTLCESTWDDRTNRVEREQQCFGKFRGEIMFATKVVITSAHTALRYTALGAYLT